MMRRTPRFVPGDGVNHDSKGFSNVEEELRGGFRSVTHIFPTQKTEHWRIGSALPYLSICRLGWICLK